jgi:hypothetical protein
VISWNSLISIREFDGGGNPCWMLYAGWQDINGLSLEARLGAHIEQMDYSN